MISARKSLLFIAICVTMVGRSYADVIDDHRKLFYQAIGQLNVSRVRTLLKTPYVDVSDVSSNWTPLHYAIARAADESNKDKRAEAHAIVKLILDAGAMPEAYDDAGSVCQIGSILVCVSIYGLSDILDELLKHKYADRSTSNCIGVFCDWLGQTSQNPLIKAINFMPASRLSELPRITELLLSLDASASWMTAYADDREASSLHFLSTPLKQLYTRDFCFNGVDLSAAGEATRKLLIDHGADQNENPIKGCRR